MREKTIEQHLVKEAKRRGGIAPKLVSPGFDGMPDRLVLLPKGRIAFVEVKAPGETPRPLQASRHRLLMKWWSDCNRPISGRRVDSNIRIRYRSGTTE